MSFVDSVKFDSHGLLPAVVQDEKTKEVIMLAYMNKESIEKTLETNEIISHPNLDDIIAADVLVREAG